MPINPNKHHYLAHYAYKKEVYKAWVTIDLNIQADGITAEMIMEAIRLKIAKQENVLYIGMEIVWVTKL